MTINNNDSFDGLAKALAGYVGAINTGKRLRERQLSQGTLERPRNNTLLRSYTAAVKQAQEFTDSRFNHDAIETTRQDMFREARNTYLPQIEALTESTSKPINPEPLAKAVGVNFNNTAAVNAMQVKWPQVLQLLDAGKLWADIIEQADQPMLAAILEHAPTYLQTLDSDDVDSLVAAVNNATITGVAPKGPKMDTVLDDIRVQVARRAVELGNSGAAQWLNTRAGQAYDTVIAHRLDQHARDGLASGAPDIAVVAEMWDREAQTRAAQVKGEPTPNERDRIAQREQAQQRFAQQTQQPKYAPGESPSELAARIGRPDLSKDGYQ